jgi:hypothetical protein
VKWVTLANLAQNSSDEGGEKMLDQERRRVDKNPSEEVVALRDFAEKIIRGDENRSRQGLTREERWRRIEVGGDWLEGGLRGGG